MNQPPMDPLSDRKIIDSWHTNAAPWTNAVRNAEIESRNLVTNRAIIDAVMSRAPKTALDIGCGEGWLARELSALGVEVTGIDAIPELITKATAAGGGDFRVASYEEIVGGTLDLKVDIAVANFSLIGEAAVNRLIHYLPSVLEPRGSLVIQTMHPLVSTGDDPYEDGWRKGSWDGFSNDFSDPAPWYFRTVTSWITLLVESGFILTELREPLSPRSHLPASIIFIAGAADRFQGDLHSRHRSKGPLRGENA